MAMTVAFIVETFQGSFIPVLANVHPVVDIGDCALSPHSYSMPYVLLNQAQTFLQDNIPIDMLMYERPIKMNNQGLKWLSEVEKAQ